MSKKSKKIWILFHSADFCNYFISWYSEFPQLGHIEKNTPTLTNEQRVELLDNHEVHDKHQNQWTLELIKEGD